MTLLGIDSSGPVCTASVARNGVELASFSLAEKGGHSTALLPGIKAILEESALSLSDLSAIAISTGPGSYTGLRIGIATAKGLAAGSGLSCIPLSSLEVLCMRFPSDFSGYVCSLLDARRDEFYAAVFHLQNGIPERITEDRAILFHSLQKECSSFEGIRFIGSGAEKFEKLSEKKLPPIPKEWHEPSGICVCRLAELYGENAKREAPLILPSYCKLTEAERNLNSQKIN